MHIDNVFIAGGILVGLKAGNITKEVTFKFSDHGEK